MDNNGKSNRKEFASLPISKKDYELVKKKQLELSLKNDKIIPLSEIASQLVRKGLDLIE